MQQPLEGLAAAFARVDLVVAERHGPPDPARADVLTVDQRPQREDVDGDPEVAVLERVRVLGAAVEAGVLEPRELLVRDLEQRVEAEQPAAEVTRQVVGLVADAVVDGRPGVLHDRAHLDLRAQPGEPLVAPRVADDVVIGPVAEAVGRIVLAAPGRVRPVDVELALDQRADGAHVVRVVDDHAQADEVGHLLERVGVLALARDLLDEALDGLGPRLDLRERDRLAVDRRAEPVAERDAERVVGFAAAKELCTPVTVGHWGPP